MREGNLQAPTRHPINWKNPKFYDADDCLEELTRIFDICHGCRRCVSLCNAFPKLFDLIDDSDTGEIDGVATKDYWAVVDQCYLCDLCYMTKCPYVPPHDWNLDFPHTMLRAKAIQFKQGKSKFRDKLLSSTDALGKVATIPMVAGVVNAANKNTVTRRAMEATLGIKKERWLPPYDSKHFLKTALPAQASTAQNGARTPGKVAIFSTCYIKYNEPGIGHDLCQILDHNQIPYTIVNQDRCCGMPKFELGDLERVEKFKTQNVASLLELAKAGYAIMTPVPSCTLMFKSELPLLFPEDDAVKTIANAMFDPFEYFVLRHKDGLLANDFKHAVGTIAYHIPCHSRVQNMGKKTEEMLKLAGAEVQTVERCAGHDGTWGVKKEYYEISMKIGRPVFKAMHNAKPDYIASDCAIACRHIQQGIHDYHEGQMVPKAHPISLLRMAYGL